MVSTSYQTSAPSRDQKEPIVVRVSQQEVGGGEAPNLRYQYHSFQPIIANALFRASALFNRFPETADIDLDSFIGWSPSKDDLETFSSQFNNNEDNVRRVVKTISEILHDLNSTNSTGSVYKDKACELVTIALEQTIPFVPAEDKQRAKAIFRQGYPLTDSDLANCLRLLRDTKRDYSNRIIELIFSSDSAIAA